MFENFTDRVLKAFARADDVAYQTFGAVVDPDHLLVALLEDRHSIASSVLRGVMDGLGGTIDFATALQRLLEFRGMANRVRAKVSHRKIPLSEETTRLCELSPEIAKEYGDRYVGTEHVLVAILRTDNKAKPLLGWFGISEELAMKEINKFLGQDPEATVADEQQNLGPTDLVVADEQQNLGPTDLVVAKMVMELLHTAGFDIVAGPAPDTEIIHCTRGQFNVFMRLPVVQEAGAVWRMTAKEFGSITIDVLAKLPEYLKRTVLIATPPDGGNSCLWADRDEFPFLPQCRIVCDGSEIGFVFHKDDADKLMKAGVVGGFSHPDFQTATKKEEANVHPEPEGS